MYRSCLRLAVLCAFFLAACGSDGERKEDLDGSIGSVGAGDGGTLPLPPGCGVEDGINPPKQLECTGLYANLLEKRVNDGVREFAPAVALWSDGAEKTRWIWLPPGTQIDTTEPGDWKFPLGTKVWKEFRVKGQRVETRFMHKGPTGWLRYTYAWANGDTVAALSFGGDITGPDGPYHLPDGVECRRCHEGRKDNLLGFEGPLLGMPGATGVTLATLINEGRLSQPPSSPTYTMGDDGTGVAATALPYLHVNCGVSCHSPNTRAEGAEKTGMVLRIEPNELQGVPVTQWRMYGASVSADARLSQFVGMKRIVPGDPDNSLIYLLATNRESNQRMPPIASRLVDHPNMGLVRDWILRLGALHAPDAGSGPANDAGVPDAATPTDAGVPIADAAPPAPQDSGVPPVEVDAYVPPVEPVVDAYVPPPVEPEVDAYVPPPEPEVDAYVPPPVEPEPEVDAYVPPVEPEVDAYVPPAEPEVDAAVPEQPVDEASTPVATDGDVPSDPEEEPDPELMPADPTQPDGMATPL